ncbi:MAG: glycosyltransferase family 4 protein [Muribaculaceae bacterium]|nr:glycosyltransferase family 4 protein [Muribaculaceae bacterium]
MRILIINYILFTPDKGIIPKVNSIKDTMIYGMCRGFIDLGHSVTLAAGEEYKPQTNETYDCEVLFFKSNFKKLFNPTVLPYSSELKDFLKKNHSEYDLIITSEVFSFLSLYAARICPEKTIIWHELAIHQRKFKKLPSKIWYNIVAPILMNKVFCVVPRSKQAQMFISRYMPNVSVPVDHGIDINKFQSSASKKRQVISSSQLIPRKRIDGIIDVFHKLVNMPKYADFKLIIAGRGPELESLQKKVYDLGIEKNVEFVGFLAQKVLNIYMRESMVFLINTLQDNSMLAIPEALASGTPVITTSIPNTTHNLGKDKLGIVDDNWDINELCEIIDNNNAYVSACIEYRENLSNKYSATKMIEFFSQYANNANA